MGSHNETQCCRVGIFLKALGSLHFTSCVVCTRASLLTAHWDLSHRILGSCTGLMQAIQVLVLASKDLQREIVESGRVSRRAGSEGSVGGQGLGQHGIATGVVQSCVLTARTAASIEAVCPSPRSLFCTQRLQVPSAKLSCCTGETMTPRVGCLLHFHMYLK